MLIIKELLPEVATASRLNLRSIEARATLGSRVVSSSPLKRVFTSKFCLFVCYFHFNGFHGKHPLSQMPQSDPRDNSLPSGNGKPTRRLKVKLKVKVAMASPPGA